MSTHLPLSLTHTHTHTISTIPVITHLVTTHTHTHTHTHTPTLPGTADVMQPNLDMLNPTLDELLDRLEPMEGNHSSLATFRGWTIKKALQPGGRYGLGSEYQSNADRK